MTRQNKIHRHVVEYEKYRKQILKNCQRINNGKRVTRVVQNRKWWKQFDKDFHAKWRKAHENAQKAIAEIL